MSKDRILLVDASPLIYAVYNTQGFLATQSGEPTGLLYGFLRSVRSWQEKTKCNKVVLCFDLPGKVTKAANMPEYKSNREFTEEKQSMYAQVPALREMLRLTQWTQIDAEGYEADDVIGTVARAKAAHGHKCVIVSTDNDMCQLVNQEISIFMPGKKNTPYPKACYRDEQEIINTWGVPAQALLAYRAVVGDVSDNISRALSPAPAELALTELRQLLMQSVNWGTVVTPEQLYKLAEPHRPWSLVFGGEEVRKKIEHNYDVMRLHTPPALNIIKGERNVGELTKLFERLEFKSMMKYIPELCGVENASSTPSLAEELG